MKQTQENKNRFLSSLLGEMTVEKSSGLAFSAAVLLPVLLSFVFVMIAGAAGLFVKGVEEQDWYRYFNFLLPQISFAIVCFAFFYLSKTSVKTVIGTPKWYYFAIALILQFGLLALSELNTWFIEFLESFGYENSSVQLPSLAGGGVFGVLLVVAVLPAVFEELLFRGVLLKGLRSFPIWAAALLCGGMFSLFHQNPAQTVYQFCCGAAFALVALRSGSVLPTVLMHFFNNGLIIVLEYFGASVEHLPLPVLIAAIVCLLGSVFFLVFEEKLLKKTPTNIFTEEKTGSKKEFFLCAAVGLTVCIAVWFFVLFGGA
ncbi:MAG: CPBP family intramembrane metalloprotease [Clostridia bacterium]|nr:CPBP family intramembrane metalloprotease [Clostridia bacterium]